MSKANLIEETGLIVIMRGLPEEKLEPTLNALCDGGVRVIEIAFDPSDSATVGKTCGMISRAAELAKGAMTIGAGTVLRPEWVTAAHKAGAEFIFSPNTDPEIIRLTKKLGMLSLPGALTPSEIASAYYAGADMVKLFPVTVDDLGYITNVMRPLSHIPIICVGGTNENTIPGFFAAGASAVGTGISILKPELIEAGDYAEITRLARLHIDRIKACRQPHRNS